MNHWNWNIFWFAIAFGGAAAQQEEKTLQLSPNFVLKTIVNSDTGIMDFVATVRTTGWFGIGINHHPVMMGADMAIGTIDAASGRPRIADYHGGDHKIDRDEQQDVQMLDSDSFKNSTHIQIHYQRKLATGDLHPGQDEDIKNAEDFIIWAFGESKVPIFHGPNFGSQKVNLREGEQQHGSSSSTTTPKPAVRTSTIRPSVNPNNTSGAARQYHWNNFVMVSVLLALAVFH